MYAKLVRAQIFVGWTIGFYEMENLGEGIIGLGECRYRFGNHLQWKRSVGLQRDLSIRGRLLIPNYIYC